MVRIGGPLTIVAIGLIISLAVKDSIAGVDLTLVGYILIGAGALALILSIAFNRPKGINRSTETKVSNDPASGEQVRRTDVQDM